MATDSTPRTLVKMTDGRIPDIRYGIKFSGGNIGFSEQQYTFPLFPNLHA